MNRETIYTMFGIPVVVTDLAVRKPTPGEDARAIVRHGLADVLRWLGEDVGRAPGEPVPCTYIIGEHDQTLLMTRGTVDAILRRLVGG